MFCFLFFLQSQIKNYLWKYDLIRKLFEYNGISKSIPHSLN